MERRNTTLLEQQPMTPVIQEAIPVGLREYLTNWAYGNIVATGERFGNITSEAGARDFLGRNGIRGSEADAVLDVHQEEWAQAVALHIVSGGISRQVEKLTRHAGLAVLGTEGSAALYEQVAEFGLTYMQLFVSWENALAFGISLPEDARDGWERQVANLNGKGKMSNSARVEALQKWFIDSLFESSVMWHGEAHVEDNVFNPKNAPKPEDITSSFNRDRIIRRIREGVIDGGEQWRNILERHVAGYRQLGGVANEMLYVTPQTERIGRSLQEANLLGTEIPWLIAEGVVSVEQRVLDDITRYASTNAFAMELVYGLILHDTRVLSQLEQAGISVEETTTMVTSLTELSTWKIPDIFFRLSGQIHSPLVISRPDFARVRQGDEIVWMATEHENAPGGLGMLLVAALGYGTDNGEELLSYWQEMMAEIALPNEQINRQNLTVVMSEDWAAYRTDMQLFLNALTQRYGIQTGIRTIEELAHGDEIASGFVFHFAYPWNEVKTPETLSSLEKDSSPEEVARHATSLRNATAALYDRHGEDIYIFNDPSVGLLMYSKLGMAAVQLPNFAELLSAYLRQNGYSTEHAASAIEQYYRMIPETVPLINTNGQLGEHVSSAIEEACANPESMLAKLTCDPAGQEDWGARGITHTSDMRNVRAELLALRDHDRPYALQRYLYHQRWETRRDDSQLRMIDGNGREEIIVFNNDPTHSFLSVGEGVAESMGARWNPFFITYRNREGKMITKVARGSMTLTPLEEGQYKVHGTSQSAEVPVVVIERGQYATNS